MLLALALASCPALQSPGIDPQEAARSAWLRLHAIGVTTVEAEHGFDDLAGLSALIGDARIVGLGEGTHGTREHFQMKHRLLEYLVTQRGFSIFAIEANMPEAQELDAYVLGADGDVNRLIGGMYFWTWNTEEVRDMVEWMRRFNAGERERGSSRRVHFTGFDMQTGTVALSNVRAFLKEHDPELERQHAATFDALAAFEPSRAGSREFGCATCALPLELARGKRVRLSGWIKTEGLDDGFAGLWMRVDGPEKRFDNMEERAPHGTSDWTEARVEFDVPQSAQQVVFGLVMPGTGRAWFDELRVEIDGVPWSSPDVDLDFDGERPKGLVAADPSGGAASRVYDARFDASVAHGAGKSYRFERRAVQGPDPRELQRQLELLCGQLRFGRERYAASAGAETARWRIQDAQVLLQWVGRACSEESVYAHRDRCMAENVEWLARENPDARIVLWAHNGHVQNEKPFMGEHLRRAFGERYLNVGFTSAHGTYYAMKRGSEERVHRLQDPPEQSFEAWLEPRVPPLCIVDLRAARADDPGSAWLTQVHPFGGTIGALAMEEHYSEQPLQGSFDLLVFMRETTAARQLETRPGRR